MFDPGDEYGSGGYVENREDIHAGPLRMEADCEKLIPLGLASEITHSGILPQRKRIDEVLFETSIVSVWRHPVPEGEIGRFDRA
jgi:hypothetical protein